ncbi:MAG: lamin tail domain-containing protein [Kovacikia sp.]
MPISRLFKHPDPQVTLPNYAAPSGNGRRRSSVPLLLKRFGTIGGLCVSAALVLQPTQAQAQIQRSFLNPSFEQPAFSPTSNCYIQVDESFIPGWSTTHSTFPIAGNCSQAGYTGGKIIEIWTTTFQGVSTATTPTSAGRQFAELNAEQTSQLYQNLCLYQGETITFSLLHRGRSSATTPDVTNFLIGLYTDPASKVFGRFSTTSNGTVTTQPVAQNGATIPAVSNNNAGNGWVRYNGTVPYTGTTGNQPVGFAAVSTAGGNNTIGNFLDDVQFAGKPVLELVASSGGAAESETTPTTNPPRIRVVGLVPTGGTTISISVGGTAILGTDFTTTSGTSTFNLTIPAGNYDGSNATSLFTVPFTVISNNIPQGSRTITFTIQPSSSFFTSSTMTCGGSPITTSTYTIYDDDFLSGKVWDDADNSANNTFTNINTGSESGTNAGGLLYAILVDSSNSVLKTTPVAADGTYTFTNVALNQSNVKIILSTTAGTVGSAAPTASLPPNWVSTSPLTTATFSTGTNISSKDFGIEQLPNTTNLNPSAQPNPGGTTTVQVPTLTGTDPEDGALGSGKTFKIVTLPTNGTLTYNNAIVSAGQTISNYNPALLRLDPNDGVITVSFTYAAIDAAGKEDTTPATVSMPFVAPTADLSVTKTDGQASTIAGSPISYTITVTNNGPSTVNSLTLTETLPAAIQSPVFTPSTGLYNSDTGAWTGLNLASGQGITLTLNGTVSATAGTLINTATVAPPSGITDPTSGNNTATDNTAIYAIAPTAGKIVINEVLYAQTGSGSAGNDEFIELYNASSSSVDLSNWKLSDGNLIENDTDGIGSITGNLSSPAYLFPSGTTLAPGQYAVIWIGDNVPDHQAAGAAFQTWLGQIAKLNNAGDDIWLYDAQTRIVDYVAYGSGSAINTPPPNALNLWNATYQASLASANNGQSISLTPNGQDGNTSACWEPATSSQANGRCSGSLPTRDTDTVGSRVNSVGGSNNGVVATPPSLLLVKRITAINGVDIASIVDDPGSTNDNAANWPLPLNGANNISTYLRGQINGGTVKPGDLLEYTIYFLSNGGTAATNIKLCDLVPANSTFVPASFTNSPESGISLTIGPISTNLTNVPDSDGGQFFNPGATPSVTCSAANTNGAVVVNVVKSPATLPNATAPGIPSNSYGFIRFRARVN